MPLPNSLQLPLCAALLLAPGCASRHWDGSVQQYGSVREAMTNARTTRIPLAHAAKRHRWGLGVLEDAAGEVVVADGFVWVGRGLSPNQARTDAGFGRRECASWLALARVPRWSEHQLERSLDLEGVGALAAELGAREGWDPARPLPFVVIGGLADIELHVLRGACPHAGEPGPDQTPFGVRFSAAHGTLVGLHAPGAGGELVHHGESTHVHALLRQPSTLAAHVERALVMSGARLRIPAGR